MISSHIDHRPLNGIKRSKRSKLCDFGKYCIIAQRVDKIHNTGETCDLLPYYIVPYSLQDVEPPSF